MWYAIMTKDHDNSLANRMAARPEHVARLKDLASQERLLIAGPHPAIDSSDPGDAGFTGSLIVADFNTLADAQAWAEADPYMAAGVTKSISVKPYNRVLP